MADAESSLLSIDKIESQKGGLFTIKAPNWTVTGVMQDDLNISGGNEYTGGFLGAGLISEAIIKKAEIQRSLNLGANAVGFGKAFGADIGDQLPLNAILNWTGSKKPIFQINVVFIALKDNDEYDVINKANKLYEAVFPTGGRTLIETFKAPMGYNGSSGSGTVILEVGEWFRASGLVVKDVGFTYSKTCLRSGRPLFATGQIVLEPYRPVGWHQFSSWFKPRVNKPQVPPTTQSQPAIASSTLDTLKRFV